MVMPNKEGGSSSYIRRRQQRTIDGKSIHIPRSNSSCATSIIDSDEEEQIDKMKTVGPLTIRGVLSSQRNLFLALLALRVVNVFLIQTTFVPDEFWQSVEVAHNWAFGYGYLTWEWRVGLRSPIYPFIFACLFKVLSLCGLDSRILVIKLPQIGQAIFAAFADLHLYKLSKRISGQYVAQWTLFSHLINWFTLYTATRTLGNSVEWGLTIIALSYYPWPNPCSQDNIEEVLEPSEINNLPVDLRNPAAIPRKAQWKFVLVVAFSVLLRPTVAVLWLPFCIYHLYSQRTFLAKLIPLYAFIGLFCLGLSALIEKHFYGKWTLSQWNFLEFNVLSDASRFYGVHPWHWYVTQGWPLMLTTQLPIFLIAVFTEATTSANKLLLGSILWTIYIYSFRAHKEFRFLFPLVPLAMHFCGLVHSRWNRPAPYGLKAIYHRTLILMLLITQVGMAFYSGLVHQRGGNDAIMALGRRAEYLSSYNAELGRLNSKPLFSAMFLMPCHSTPYYSHIHYNVTLRFLTCDPDLSGQLGKSYIDEADQFYSQPVSWLQRQYSAPHSRPMYFILFDVLVESSHRFSQELADLLARWNYFHCRTFFHAHFPLGRQGSRVYAFCSSGSDL